MSKEILNHLPNSRIAVKVRGDFNNGLMVTGGAINRTDRNGDRWVTVFYKNHSGTNVKILADGTLDTSECADVDVAAYMAVYNAAMEQVK